MKILPEKLTVLLKPTGKFKPAPINSVMVGLIALLIPTLLFSAPADDQKKLEELVNQIKEQSETIEMQKKDIEAMEKRLECNYNLLQSYNKCEEKHEKSSDSYVNCMKKAKSDGGSCLNG